MSKKLSEQVAELEDRLQREEAEAIFWECQYRESHNHWENWVDELKRKCERLRAENAELRAGRGRWPKGESALKEMAATLDSQMSTTIRQGSPEPDDDFPCCSGTPPRLTVHKLNTAPVGSWISRGMGSNARRKDADGKWHRAWMFEGQHPESSEELIANGWADATIAYPEDQR